MTTTMEQRNLARKVALDHHVELGERGIAMVASLIGESADARATLTRIRSALSTWRAAQGVDGGTHHDGCSHLDCAIERCLDGGA